MEWRFCPYTHSWCLQRLHGVKTITSNVSLTAINWAVECDFQQFDILTSLDSDEPLQPPFKLKHSKRCSVSSLTIIEYSRDLQRLWSDCAYSQADLRLCWSHIPHCWKSHALTQLWEDSSTIWSLTLRDYWIVIIFASIASLQLTLGSISYPLVKVLG